MAITIAKNQLCYSSFIQSPQEMWMWTKQREYRKAEWNDICRPNSTWIWWAQRKWNSTEIKLKWSCEKKTEIKEQQTIENILKSFKLSQYVYFRDESKIKKKKRNAEEQSINPMKTTTKKENSYYRFRRIERPTFYIFYGTSVRQTRYSFSISILSPHAHKGTHSISFTCFVFHFSQRKKEEEKKKRQHLSHQNDKTSAIPEQRNNTISKSKITWILFV